MIDAYKTALRRLLTNPVLYPFLAANFFLNSLVGFLISTALALACFPFLIMWERRRWRREGERETERAARVPTSVPDVGEP